MGSSKYWIKLYHEILHDPKMGRLPDNLWRRAIELFLMAGELDQGGELPPVSDMAWTMRIPEGQLEQELEALAASDLEIVTRISTGWIVTRFADRQSAMSSAERVRRHRENKHKEEYYGDETEEQQECNAGVTNRYTDIDKEKDREGESESPTHDYLDDVFAGVAGPGIADPSQDKDNWLQYRDKAINAYHKLTDLHPNDVAKGAIGNLAGEGDFDLQKWRGSVESCLLNGVKPGNVSCMIDTYRAGGDYQSLWKNKNGKSGESEIETENGKQYRVVK